MVNLDSKVKQWQGVPASVTGLLSTLRNETTALSDASRFFDPSKKSAVPDRMKECIDALVGSGMDFPVGMRGYYMVEQITDYMRLNQMDDIVEACHPTDGILKGCVPDREAQDFIIDLMGSLLKDIVATMASPMSDDDKQKLAFAGALSSKLDASGHLSLAAADLQTFADAFRVGDLDFDRRQGALQRLGELAADDDYAGFLKGFSQRRG